MAAGESAGQQAAHEPRAVARQRPPVLYGVARLPAFLTKVAVWLCLVFAVPVGIHVLASPQAQSDTAGPAPKAGTAVVKAVVFPSCHALRASHPGGVARPGAMNAGRPLRPAALVLPGKALYAANRALDSDHDGIACERVRKHP